MGMDSSTLKSRLETAKVSFRNMELQLADPDVASDPKKLETIARERSRLEPLVVDYELLQKVEHEFDEARSLYKESKEDKDMESLAQEEMERIDLLKTDLISRITVALLPKDPREA